jgi:hypothetical protein
MWRSARRVPDARVGGARLSDGARAFQIEDRDISIRVAPRIARSLRVMRATRSDGARRLSSPER